MKEDKIDVWLGVRFFLGVFGLVCVCAFVFGYIDARRGEKQIERYEKMVNGYVTREDINAGEMIEEVFKWKENTSNMTNMRDDVIGLVEKSDSRWRGRVGIMRYNGDKIELVNPYGRYYAFGESDENVKNMGLIKRLMEGKVDRIKIDKYFETGFYDRVMIIPIRKEGKVIGAFVFREETD